MELDCRIVQLGVQLQMANNVDMERKYANGADSDGSGEFLEDKKGKLIRTKKDKGYAHLEGGESEEEQLVGSNKSSKSKKGKFKFAPKTAKDKQSSKLKPSDSFKKKKVSKILSKASKDDTDCVSLQKVTYEPVFGAPLQLAVQRNRSHDGIPVPVVVRMCIDCVNEFGLGQEGIYRTSVGLVQLQTARRLIDEQRKLELPPNQPEFAAALLKLFLRELPHSLLTARLSTAFEEAIAESASKEECVNRMLDLLSKLPKENYFLLAYLFLHMHQVISHASENKMNLANIGVVLHPVLKISQSLLDLFLNETDRLFGMIRLQRYICPLKPKPGRVSIELPSSQSEIEAELMKQESLLEELHEAVYRGFADPVKLWDVQCVITQLKRQQKMMRQLDCKNIGFESQLDCQETQGPLIEMLEEKQLWAVYEQLREEALREQRDIIKLVHLIRQKQIKASDEHTEDDDTADVSDDESFDWDEELKALEAKRDALLAKIIDERHQCALLQAELERTETQTTRL